MKFTKSTLAALLLLAALPMTAFAGDSSFRHQYLMRGQVLESNGGAIVVCIGKEDGAAVGQVLQVVRHVRLASSAKKAGPRYRRDPVGSIRIVSLFDGHYADAQVIAGTPQVNDMVELASR